MPKGIEHIVRNYVQLKDRVALERMRDHLNSLLHDESQRATRGYRTVTLEEALRDDIETLDDGIARLSDA
jgi:hypothetical protein